MGTEREPPRGAAPDSRAPTERRQSARSTPIRRRPAEFHVGAVDDPAERQADAFADRILRSMGSSGVHDSHPPGEVAMRDGGPLDGATSRILRSAGAGRPLDEPVRRKIQPMVPTDLSDVRVHTGRAADEVARRIQARAFTVGTDIYFRDGEHRPGGGVDRTLAHELGHVAQGEGRIRRLPSPPQAIADVKTVKGAKSAPGKLVDLKLATTDEEVALRSIIEIGDTLQRLIEGDTVQRLLGLDEGVDDDDDEYGDVDTFTAIDGISHSLVGTGAVSSTGDALSGALTGVKGGKNFITGFTKHGTSLDRNIGAKQIESGTVGMFAGGGGAFGSVASLAGEEIPFLDVAMGYAKAGIKGKASIEDSVAAARLQHQKQQAKREADARLPESVRMARYDEFLRRLHKKRNARRTKSSAAFPSAATATAQGAGAATAQAAGTAAGKRTRGRTFKSGEIKRFEELSMSFRQETGYVAETDKAEFLDWLKSNHHKDFGFGTHARRGFEKEFQQSRGTGALAAQYPGFDEQEYTEARNLRKVASFGRRRKAETASVNAVDAAGAAVDATGTMTAAGDFGATKATGKVIKAGSASYKGTKNLVKRARRVHKLRTAKNEVDYGGKSKRRWGWEAKMFLGGNIARSQQHTRTAVEQSLAGTAPPASAKSVNAQQADVKSVLRRLYTQRERRFNDLWTCLLSDDNTIRERAYAVVQAIANTSLVGALARVSKHDLKELYTLKTRGGPGDADKLTKMKGQLSDIFQRELSGIGG